jgi:hypothetical protein
MDPSIPDDSTESRMAGLERFLERYLGPRRPEFGESDNELRSIEMPAPLSRFFRFAGRWPGQNPQSPNVNRFCMQDTLCSIRSQGRARPLETMDDRLNFVYENQGVWIASTERAGADPPVWISEGCSHREPHRIWRRLENPLSHFLVSFVLQEILFGSQRLAVAPEALARFEEAGVSIEPVWLRGEYAWGIDRPSFFLAGDHFLVRHAPAEADGDDWYGYSDEAGENILKSLGLPTEIR